MAICKNKIELSVSSDGWNYRVREYPCSSTGPEGQLILCEQCEWKRKDKQADIDHDNVWLRSAGWGEI